MTWAVKPLERALVGGQLALTAGSAVGAVALWDASDWHPVALFALLLVLATVSEAFRLETKKFRVSAAFLALVLAMALLGPTPAAALGVFVMGVNGIRRRAHWRHTLANISTYACFPLLGGAAFEAMNGPALLESNAATYILIVFTLFIATNVLNFLLIATDIAIVDGQPLR